MLLFLLQWLQAAPMFPFQVVAFDLDGTLADTAPDLAAALNHALGALGRPAIPPASVRYLVGQGARALLRRGLDATGGSTEELVELGFPHFIDFYADHICEKTRIFPGVEQALANVEAAGARLALCTNKPELLTLKLLQALGWSDRFASIVCGDTLPVRKPDPAPLRRAIAEAGGGSAVFVGDSITDADTAAATGLPFIAVSFGYCDRPLAELRAAAVIDGFDELLAAISSLKAASTDSRSRP
jgi:phosphoglycolate phosphatase